jgi:hypothetical protein
MGLSMLAAHPKRRPTLGPERDLAGEELRLQIQRDIRLASHNDMTWMDSFINVAEMAMQYVNTRQRTVESRGARDVQIAHGGTT